MPPETVTVVVPNSGPFPTRSETVTWVVLSLVSRLPYLVQDVDDRLRGEDLTGRRRG